MYKEKAEVKYYMDNYYSEKTNFFQNTNPMRLIEEYGSPIYVYNQRVFRKKCREMTSLIEYPNFKVTYSIKANSNLELLKIARKEGMHADAMSPGEIFVLTKAGFEANEIFYISNNVSRKEMSYAVERGIMTSVDSLSQLGMYGQINPGGKVAVRLNPGIGAGHHEKVVTGGKKSKFGINLDKIDEIKKIAKKYNLEIVGINQHIGSLFMKGDAYLTGVQSVLDSARQFENLDFVDFGGGFGVPYKKQEGQAPMELEEFGFKFNDILTRWVDQYGKQIMFRIEPGRYVAAEAGILIGTVNAIKNNYGIKFIGTDIGFNVIKRPVMYESHHDIEIYRKGHMVKSDQGETVTVVGNICESGDIVAKNRFLPVIEEGDLLGVMDAGAYCYSMASNYNNRFRPAEVLIEEGGAVRLIRRRDTFEDLIRNFC